MIQEILSNQFNIDINKEVGNPSLSVISNSFNININKTDDVAVEGVSISPKTHVLNKSNTLQLNALVIPNDATNKNVSYVSSDNNVATVDENGIVAPVEVGDVEITVVTEEGNYTDVCSITVIELVPSISDVIVSNVDYNGNYKLTYMVKNLNEKTLTHKLKVGSNNYISIEPSNMGNIYNYIGSGLSYGEYICTIQVSDGYYNLTSTPFKIIVPEKQEGVKPLLKQAKDDYDARHEYLKMAIQSIIDDGIFEEEERELLDIALNEYNVSLANFSKVSQQCIDAIAQKKAEDAESSSKKYTEAQIAVVSDAITLKVSQSEYDSNKNEVNKKMSEIVQTADGISLEVSKKVNGNEVVSSINQSAEAVKIKANKIQFEGSTTIGSNGNYVQVDDYTYNAFVKHQRSIGIGAYQEGSIYVPHFMMSDTNIYAATSNVFAMKAYGNAQHLAYRRKSDQAWSVFEMNDAGNFVLSPAGKSVFNKDADFNNSIHMKGSNLDVRTSSGTIAGRFNYQGLTTNQISNISGGTINVQGNLRSMYSYQNLGTDDGRWQKLYCVTAPDVSSDGRLKSNIKYIDNDTYCECGDTINQSEMYDFIKNDLKIAEYNYGDEENITLGFIAQDLVGTKVGDRFIRKNPNDYLSYDLSGYITVLYGALQKSIDKNIMYAKRILESTYSGDYANFNIEMTSDISLMSEDIDYELYELIDEVISEGKHNYNRNKMESMIDFYAMGKKLTFRMADELFFKIETQYQEEA